MLNDIHINFGLEYSEYNHGYIIDPSDEEASEFDEDEANRSPPNPKRRRSSITRAVFDRGGASNPHILKQLEKRKDWHPDNC